MKVTITLEDQAQGMSLDIDYGGPKDPTSHAAYMAGEFLRLLDEKAKPVAGIGSSSDEPVNVHS